MADDEVVLITKSKEQMRYEPHEYNDDTTGWCTVCGRSMGWQAHAAIGESVTLPAAPVEIDTLPVEVGPLSESPFTTDPLDE